MGDQKRIYIRVPSPYSFLVTCDGQEVSNWRDLEQDARQAAEPLVRLRWLDYWHTLRERSIQATGDNSLLEDVMRVSVTPSMEYSCPPELAAKAIVEEHPPTATPDAGV